MLRELRELAEGYVFDPSLIDLVVWFPHLTWIEFASSLAVVVSWRIVMDRIERFFSRAARRVTARLLLRLALYIRPRVAAE